MLAFDHGLTNVGAEFTQRLRKGLSEAFVGAERDLYHAVYEVRLRSLKKQWNLSALVPHEHVLARCKSIFQSFCHRVNRMRFQTDSR